LTYWHSRRVPARGLRGFVLSVSDKTRAQTPGAAVRAAGAQASLFIPVREWWLGVGRRLKGSREKRT